MVAARTGDVLKGDSVMDLCKMSLEQIKRHIDALEARVAAVEDADPEPRAGQYVIVRCRDAGVHCGILVESSGAEVR
jgi:hypothetical protein